jgi:hypothetical protein
MWGAASVLVLGGSGAFSYLALESARDESDDGSIPVAGWVAIGAAVVGLIPLYLAPHYGRIERDERATAFSTYQADLLDNLNLCVDQLRIVDCGSKGVDAGSPTPEPVQPPTPAPAPTESPTQTYAEAVAMICNAPSAAAVAGSAEQAQSMIADHITKKLEEPRASQQWAGIWVSDESKRNRISTLKAMAAEAKLVTCPLADMWTNQARDLKPGDPGWSN